MSADETHSVSGFIDSPAPKEMPSLPPTPPRSVEGELAPPTPAEKRDHDGKQLVADSLAAQRHRLWTGRVLGAVGAVIVLWIGHAALVRIAAESTAAKSRYDVWMFAIKVLAEASVSIAMIFFGYQLLRVAERMMVPPSMMTRDNIDTLRALIGVETPVDGASRAVRSLTDLAQTIKKPPTETP